MTPNVTSSTTSTTTPTTTPSTPPTSGRDGSAALGARLGEVADRAEISELINRYVILLDTQDERGFDDSWPASVFTEDVRLEFPLGIYEGLDGLADFHYRAKRKFARTHHISGNHGIDLHGDLADIRCQMIATHVWADQWDQPRGGQPELFRVGGYYEGQAARTAHGWRLRRWACRVVWHEGVGQVELDYSREW